MKKKPSVRNIFKYTFLGLAVLTYGFIFYQSAIVPKSSSEWESWAKKVWTSLINDGLHMKEKVVITKSESVNLAMNDYKFNSIDGYKENEIPIGCDKCLTAQVFPENTTNKSVQFTATPNDVVNLIQDGNKVMVEGLKTGNVTIQAKTNDNNIVGEYTCSIVEKVAPVSFTVPESITLFPLESQYIDLTFLDENLNTDEGRNYYDFNKLTITSDNVGAKVNGQYAVWKGYGNGKITVSNGKVSKDVNYSAMATSEAPIAPTTLTIEGDSNVHISDIKRNEFVQLSVNWGAGCTDTNVIWSIDNESAAIITPTGKVYGNRNISYETTPFKVKAVSVVDPNIFDEFDMTLSHINPNSISLSSSIFDENTKEFTIATGKSNRIAISYGPENVTRTGSTVNVEDNSILKASVTGNSLYIVGLKEGTTTLEVVSTFNSNITSSTYTVTVKTRGYINEDNEANFSYTVRKYISGHAFLFMIATIFTALYVLLAHIDKPNKIMLPALAATLGVGVMFAMISELIQLFVPGRSAAWSDVLIDSYGIAIGLLLVFIGVGIRMLVLYKKSKKSKQLSKKEEA